MDPSRSDHIIHGLRDRSMGSGSKQPWAFRSLCECLFASPAGSPDCYDAFHSKVIRKTCKTQEDQLKTQEHLQRISNYCILSLVKIASAFIFLAFQLPRIGRSNRVLAANASGLLFNFSARWNFGEEQDIPASYQRNLLRDCHLRGTSPAFILSSALLMEGIDPILIPDPEFQGPVVQSTQPSISSARPSPHSTHPPTLPTSLAAPHMRCGLLAEWKCPGQVAAVDPPRPQASGWLLRSPPDRRVQHSPDASGTASGIPCMVPAHPRSVTIFRSRLRRLQVQQVSPSTRTPSPPAQGIRGALRQPIS